MILFSLGLSRLRAIALVSSTLFASVIVAISLLATSESVKSDAQTRGRTDAENGNLTSSFIHPPQNFPENLLAEAQREWHHRLVSQSLSLPPQPITDTSTATTPSPTPKTQTPQLSQTIADNPTSESNQTSREKTDSSATGIKRQTPTLEPSKTVPLLDMRVAIAKEVSSLSVATSTPGQILDASGKVLGQLPAKTRTNVQTHEQKLFIGELQLPPTVWLNPTQEGLVLVGDRWYRGNLLLTLTGDSLLAVNYVNLEAYLESVVGCEMPASWPMAALKAQAIAARSYALVHSFRPANPLYDLGDSQRWQVYKGVNGEWNTTTQAVRETTGMFLSYQGGVVESMYAATDEIVAKVFGGQGMSQTGAKNLAQQGYNYLEILDNYYPGAGLALIENEE
ncbi:MAG: SpoIID/LytB domain-containing protein [Symploca sp. SIO2E6]|nr:SpoIID/LytB domain-containing protein [Symploca sp. SIO2E6]